MLRYYITDSKALGGIDRLIAKVAEVIKQGVDWIQLREKELAARELLALTRDVMAIAHPAGVKVLVNERTDVALAASADGVHLPAQSLAPSRLRTIAPSDFLIGVSSHSLEETLRAQAEGAGFVVFGPIFDTPSKRRYGAPQGLDRLRDVAHSVRIPVVALGGISSKNIHLCLDAGAIGVAGISMFQK